MGVVFDTAVGGHSGIYVGVVLYTAVGGHSGILYMWV